MVFDGKITAQRETYRGIYEEHKDRVGQEFTLIGELSDEENIHKEDVGTLYTIQFPDGKIITAYPEEIFDFEIEIFV